MKSYQSKIFISFIIFILIIYIIYHIFFNNKNKIKAGETFTEREKIIATDIRVGIIELDTLNPILSNNRNVQEVSRLIFEPLITLTEDFRLQPCLAKEWSKLDDFTYLIKLNEKSVWQDGNKFDSQDVIFTINMIKNEKNKSIYSYNIENIKKVEKIDEYTIKIITKDKEPYFEYNLIFPIMSSKYFNQKDFQSKNKNKNLVGTGMYYIAETNSDSVILKRNLNWSEQGEKELKLDYIKLNLYENANQALIDFKNKNVDILTSSNLNIEDYLETVQYNKIELINRNYFYLALNCNNKVLKDLEIRQAINHLINKEEIIKEVYFNKYKVSNFPIDFGCYLYRDNINQRQDNRIEAKEILEEEWIQSKGNLKKKINNQYIKLDLELLVNKKQAKEIETAQNIKKQLEKLGIKITVKQASEKEYKQCIEKTNYDMAVVSKTFSYSPSLYSCLGENNISNYKNHEIMDNLDKLENANSETEEREILSNIIEVYNKEIPSISLYYDTITMIYSKNLRAELTPTSYNLFYHIENWYREYDKN